MATASATQVSYHYPAGRSLAELRAIVARAFGYNEGKATANGTTTTLVDTRLSRFSNDFFVGAQVWVKYKSTSATGYTAYVTDFVSATGTLTFAPALEAATATDDAYAIFRFVTKEEIEDALNEVCRGGQAMHTLTLQTDNDLNYSLNDVPSLHRPSQVLSVLRHQMADDNLQPVPMEGWTIEENAGLLTLRLPYAPFSTDAVYVVYEIGEGGLTTDDTRTTLPPNVVRLRAVVYLMENLLTDQDATGMEKWGQLLRYWRERLAEAEAALQRAPRKAVYYHWGELARTVDPLLSAFGIEERFGS